MKKYNKYIIAGSMLATIASFTSCEKAIKVDPKQSIDLETALSTPNNINSAIVDAYATFKSARLYGRDITLFPDALADNGRATGKSGRFNGESTNARGSSFANWGTLYNNINNINLVIDAIPLLNPAASEAQTKQWLGELKFLRALSYFNLAIEYAYIPGADVPSQNFGAVPVVTKGVKTLQDAVALKPARATQADVYKLIYDDLMDAEAKLGNLTASNTNKANKQAAQALLARVALFNKDYVTALAKADAVIATSGSKLSDLTNYVPRWREKVHPESLFEVAFTLNSENIGVNESLQTSLTTLITSGNRALTGGFGDLVPTNSLLSSLGLTVASNGASAANITVRTDDIRNGLYEVGTSGRGNPFVECTKFLGKSGFTNLDNIPVLRISEAYLIKAEALATVGSPVYDLTAAKTVLVAFKQKRYSNYATTQAAADIALTATTLYEEILKQRRNEFAFEGYRFYDLKRLGRSITKQNGSIFSFDNPLLLPAIPTSEVDGNPDLKQNFGY